MTVSLLQILFLSSLIYIIIGYVRESTFNLETTVLRELLTLGVAFVLLCIIVYLAKTTLWNMAGLPHLFMPNSF